MNDPFAGLNEQQRQAVAHNEGPLLVVAGAGTGKTQVITRRIARLVADGLAKPTEILALTFTDKAAQEMTDRLYGLIGWDAGSVMLRTFNAFGGELVSRYAHHVGRSVRGGLLNETQKVLLLKHRLSDVELEYYPVTDDPYELASRIMEAIGRLQNAGVSPKRFRDYVTQLERSPGELTDGDLAEQRDLAALYDAYAETKLATQTFDYEDQLAIPLAILDAKPNIAQRLRQTYRYVLIDEYQDTSPLQDELLRRLVPSGGNIFAVGDDDQAIYGFRGAEIGNILNFRSYFGVIEPLALIENYRSGQPILDAAYRLIRHNDPDRLEVQLAINKRLSAQTDEATVRYRHYRTVHDERTAVLDELQTRLAGAPEHASRFAILARANATLKSYARGLSERGLPYTISTTINVFEQREMIQLWRLLEWIAHLATDTAISALIVGPFIGWEAARLQGVVEGARRRSVSLEAALRESAAADVAAAELVERLDDWRRLAAEESVGRLAYRLVFDYGLADRLVERAADDLRIRRVFDDLQRFLEHLQDFEGTQLLLSVGESTVGAYLDQFPRPPEIELTESDGDAAGVRLLTVHASKGLEFDTVYLVGLTARSWDRPMVGGYTVPPELTPQASQLPPIHELRRLMYVAITRAKTELNLSAATVTAGGARQATSRLFDEAMGEATAELISSVETDSEKSLQKLQRYFPLQSQMPPRLPFERDDGWLELAVGALEQFDKYPHDFYLEQVLGIVQPSGPRLGFGQAIHRAVEAYNKSVLAGEPIDEASVLERLAEAWDGRGYETAALAEAAHDRARAALRRFYLRESAEQRRVHASERPIKYELPEAKLRLSGRIDALIELPSGLEIRDYKTGRPKSQTALEKETKESFQLRTYALAIQELTGRRPAGLTLDYLVAGQEASYEPTSRVLDGHRQTLIKLADKLRRREFAPAGGSGRHEPTSWQYFGQESDDD